MWILLSDEGKSKEQIMEMTIEWFNDILYPERDDKGRPSFLAKALRLKNESMNDAASVDSVEALRYKLKIHGMPSYMIDEIVVKLREQQAATAALVYAQPDMDKIRERNAEITRQQMLEQANGASNAESHGRLDR